MKQGWELEQIRHNTYTQCECDSYLKALAQLDLERDMIAQDRESGEVGRGLGRVNQFPHSHYAITFTKIVFPVPHSS